MAPDTYPLGMLCAMMSRGFRLANFNILQQAEIARSYYSRLKTGKDVSAWQPYIEEFRNPEPQALLAT